MQKAGRDKNIKKNENKIRCERGLSSYYGFVRGNARVIFIKFGSIKKCTIEPK